MAENKVDSFIIELGFNENVIKGLQRVEKVALQTAQRIEKSLNNSFKIDTKGFNKNLDSSLSQMSRKIDKTFDRIEQRAKNTKAFKFKTQIEEAVNPRRRTQKTNTGDRAVRAAYQANMSRLNTLSPLIAKQIRSQFYSLAGKVGSMDNSKFNESLSKLNATVREAISKHRSQQPPAVRDVSSSLDKLAGAGIKAAGAIYSFQSALGMYQKIMDVGLKRASSERSIDFVFGDQAKQVKDFTSRLSDKTGMNNTEIQSQFAGFGASAKNTMGLEGSESLFENMVGYARLMGRSSEETQRALTAVSQMAGKGQIMAEELKGQLAEAIPGAVQLFAKATGKTEQQLFDEMKKGNLKAADTLQKVSAELNKQITSRGGWDTIRNSTQAELGRLQNTWENTLSNIFRGSENGLDDFAKSLTNLLNSFGGHSKDLGSALGHLMTDFSHGVDSLTDISYKVQAFFDKIQAAYKDLDSHQQEAIKKLSEGFLKSFEVIAGAAVAGKIYKTTSSILNLVGAVTRLGNAAQTSAGEINSRNNKPSPGGKPSRFNPMNLLFTGAMLDAGYERIASTPERMEAQSKLPELAKDAGLKPIIDIDSVKSWFGNAAEKIANIQSPMNDFVNNAPQQMAGIGMISPSLQSLKPPVVNIAPQPINITTQTVLDGKIIDERVSQHFEDSSSDMLFNSALPEAE